MCVRGLALEGLSHSSQQGGWVGQKIRTTGSVEHKIGKLKKTADQTFKVECPNSRFCPLGEFIPTQTQSNHGYNMGHNIRTKMPHFKPYLECGNPRFLSDCSALAVMRIRDRANSLGLFRPARFRDRRPELCLPCRDPGIEQMFGWPNSVVTLRHDLN